MSAALPQAQALHAQGVAALRAGRAADALAAFQHGLRLAPGTAPLQEGVGHALGALGRRDESIEAFRKAALLRPGAIAHYNHGTALLHAERFAEAATVLRRAVRLDPAHTGAQNNLGNALRYLGQPRAAAEAFRAALERQPNSTAYRFNLARVLIADDRFAEADAELATLLRADPDHAPAQALRGQARALLNDIDGAEAHYREAMRLRPDDARILRDFGELYRQFNKLAEAEALLGAALRANPESAQALNGYGVLLQSRGRVAEAAETYRQALAREPASDRIRFNLGTALLTLGEFAEGWPHWRRSQTARVLARRYGTPWGGEAVAGRRLLLVADQGLGDSIMFARYAPAFAAQSGAAVRLLARPALVRLLRRVPGMPEVVADADAADAAPPPYDVHCPLTSLGAIAQTTLATIPSAVPYLSADPDAVAAWQARLASLPGRRVGLVWAGSPAYSADRRRSVPTEALAALAGLPGISFVSLQKPRPAVTPPLPLADWTDELADLTDTAALIAALDLVVAVDTSVAHLAGALGRPVWLLNRFDTDWRWLLGRSDSPWYPTMRIFRQPQPGDWGAVLAEVAQALATEEGSA